MICNLCSDSGHPISQCTDSRISDSWRETLRRSNLMRGYLLNEEDLGDARRYLCSLSTPLLTGIAVQMGQSTIEDTEETQIAHLCMRIYTEAVRFEELPLEEKNEFLHWMDPDRYIDGTETGIDEDMPPLIDPDDYIPFGPSVSTHRIDPILLCLESAEELGEHTECPICYKDEIILLDMVTTACYHSFCCTCMIQHLQRKPDCPICRGPVQTLQVRHTENYEAVQEMFGSISHI